jgi:hypothetical protein
MLPFNTSAFSNLLSASNPAAQRKAIDVPFDECVAKVKDVMQHNCSIYSMLQGNLYHRRLQLYLI